MSSENENKILEFWKENNIYQKAKEKRKNGQKFYLCDGPPFATGGIHIGTAWNKALKDVYIKYKMMQGYDVYVRAGYDTHGLPIETKVEKELGVKDKKEIETRIGIDKFVKRCKEQCEEYINLMNQQFISLGVWMDFDDPYITYKNDYIEKSWKTFKKAYEKGLLYNDLHVNPHCPRCQTTMANYELEYHDMVDPAIFVKFRIVEPKTDNPTYLVIWTTTPWTLVSNVAVMANPLIKYLIAKVGEEEWIFAKDRLHAIEEVVDEPIIVVKEISGKDLVSYHYQHPLAEETGRIKSQPVVMSDEFVTTEDGSGLVHCAPGHGPEDFTIGKRYGLEIFSPVGPDGRYTDEAGEYKGKSVLEVNDEIIERLNDKGLLVHAGKVKHSYPCCWRCKTKLIYLPSKQWFIKVTGVKDKMLSELAKVHWMPDFAGKWMSNFVQDVKDWCISRQRYWGIPLPIWKCENPECNEIKVIGSAEELGVKLNDYHRPEIDKIEFTCKKCGGKMKRVPDVLDVWFDSGNAIWAGLRDGEEKYYPADMILEGKDQIRGWFYSLLGSGVVLNNEIPYQSLLMHGYVVDDKGNAMHKSLGNYVPWEDVISKYPADAVRLMALSNTTWDDLKFNWNEMNEAKNELMIINNIATYIERFYKPAKGGKEAKREMVNEPVEDLWIKSRINSLIKEVTEHLENGESFIALRKIRSFLIQDLSRFYMKLIKKREDITLLYDVFFQAMLLSGPFIPFTAERIYQQLYEKEKKEKSIFMHGWPKADERLIDKKLENEVKIASELSEVCNSLRVKGNVKLRWPLEEVVIVSKTIETAETIKHADKIIRMLSNIKTVRLDDKRKIVLSKEIEKDDEIFKPLFIDEKTREEIKDEKQKEKIRKEAVKKITEQMANESMFLKGSVEVNGKLIDYSKYITIEGLENLSEEEKKKQMQDYLSQPTPYGMVLLKIKVNDELRAEGIMSEVRRRIQAMRKELNLIEKDKIEVYIKASDEMQELIKKYHSSILGEVNAAKFNFGEAKGKLKKTWDIEEEKITIGIEQIH